MSADKNPETQETNQELPEPRVTEAQIKAATPAPEVSSEALSSQQVEQGQAVGGPPQASPVQDDPANQPLAGDAGTQTVQTGSAQSDSTAVDAPQIADDIDLIEKEWVEKAKDIVLQTKSDPHAQNKEMNKLKAEYLKKRYNRDLKLDDK